MLTGKKKHSAAHQHNFEKMGTLDEVKLMPGDALQLQQLLEGQDERLTVRIIGVMKPKSVLVTAPTVEGRLIFVREAQPFLVRAFSGLNVCAFKSKVLKAHHTPFPYLHLAYPDSVRIMRVRKSVRAEVQLVAAIHEKENGRQIASGRIVDLSVGGARVICAKPFGNTGDNFTLSFKIKLDDIEEYVQVRGVIRTVAEDEDEDGRVVTMVGLQFEDLSQSHHLLIMNLVYHYLLKEND